MLRNETSNLLTIVSIVKDDQSGLERTLRSLQGIDLSQAEVIVVDSSQQVEPTKQLVSVFLPTAKLMWVSPEGIYSAMNSGLSEAQGQYIWFLNAGDELAGTEAFNDVMQELTNGPDWIYGQVEFTKNGERGIIPPPFDYQKEKQKRFSRGRFPPHQGTITRTALIRELGGFDESFYITADYHLMLKLALKSDPLELDFRVARFWIGGISTSQWRIAIGQFHRARVETYQLIGFQVVSERYNTAIMLTRTLIGRIINH